MRIQPNATDQSIYFTIIDADGALVPAATLNAQIDDIQLNYKTSATSATTQTVLTALASATTAHTDNRGYAVASGILRVDFPDAPWAAGTSSVVAFPTFSGDFAVDGYAAAGGSVLVEMGYALQGPDTGTTELARQDFLDAAIAAIAGTATQSSLNTTNSYLADGTNGLAAIKTAVNTIDTVVDAILVDTGTTLPAQLDNLDVSSEDAANALQRLRDHSSTTTTGYTAGDELVLTTDPTTPGAYVGSTVLVGTQSRTILSYGPLDEVDGYTLSSALSPYPSNGTAVTIYGDPQAALIAYEAAVLTTEQLAKIDRLPATGVVPNTDDLAGLANVTGGITGNPFDDDPVGDGLLYEVSPPNGSSAGTTRRTVRLLAAGGGRFGLDLRLLTGSNLANVESVTLDAAATTAGWTVADYSEWPGGVWEKEAKITLGNLAAGEEGQLTVVAINKDGQPVAAKVNVVID